MTAREFRDRYWDGDAEYFALNWYGEDADVDLDAEMESWAVLESWARIDSPNAKAYKLLRCIDLGPDFYGDDAAGKIFFVDGPCPCSDYLGVSVPDMESLDLLQRRLDHLGTGIEITFPNQERGA